MEDYIAAHVLKADLEEIDRDLREKGVVPRMMAIVLIKHAFTTIGTLVDLELTLRPQYESYPTVGEAFSKTKRELEFAKYLRNKAIGHIHSQLLPKAIEWRPDLKYMLSRLGEDGTMFIVNLYVLETAINSYVDADGNHKVFDSESDLIYPPDWERFLRFVQLVVQSGIAFLDEYIGAVKPDLEMPDPDQKNLEYWLKAGQTDFSYLSKK